MGELPQNAWQHDGFVRANQIIAAVFEASLSCKF